MPPRGRTRNTQADDEIEAPDETTTGSVASPGDDDAFVGPAEDDPALADPDATGLTPGPVESEAEDIDLTAEDEVFDPNAEYVVLADAIVVTRDDKGDTAQLDRGTVVVFSEKTQQYTNVRNFWRVGAIAVNDGSVKKRTRAVDMARAAGGREDVVAAGVVTEAPTLDKKPASTEA